MDGVKAHLTLIGEYFDLQEVTARIGVEPDYQRTPNSSNPSGKPFGHSEWGIETPLSHADDIEPVIQQLLKTIQISPKEMRQVSKDFCATWHVLIYIREDTEHYPSICLSPQMLNMLAEAGAAIGFDMYFS